MAQYKSLATPMLAVCIFAALTSTALAQRKRGIRSVDFANFTYASGEPDGNTTSIVLRNGRNVFEQDMTTSYEYGSNLESVKYVDFDGDGNEEALVVIHTELPAAGAIWNEDYYVFAYRNGSPIQIFHENRYKSKGIRVVGKSLVITAFFWREQDPNCCPYATEVTTYQWRGNRFVSVSRKLKRMR